MYSWPLRFPDFALALSVARAAGILAVTHWAARLNGEGAEGRVSE